MAKHKPQRLIALAMKAGDHSPGGRYRHWHFLRRLKPPTGLTSEEWSFAIKSARFHALRALPLVETNRTPFKYALVDPVLEKVHRIAQTSGGKLNDTEPEVLTDPH